MCSQNEASSRRNGQNSNHAPFWSHTRSLQVAGRVFFLVIFEPTVLRLVSSSFTQKLCAILSTERRSGWLNNKYWRLLANFVLTVWLQFSIRYNYTVGPAEKKTKIERNKRTNANQDTEKRNPHFSLTVEVKREDEACLQSLRCQLDHAKLLLGIDCKTSLTQNADLLEQLLNCFELVMPSAVNLGPSPAASTKKLAGTRTRTSATCTATAKEADLCRCYCR